MLISELELVVKSSNVTTDKLKFLKMAQPMICFMDYEAKLVLMKALYKEVKGERLIQDAQEVCAIGTKLWRVVQVLGCLLIPTKQI